MISEGSEDYRIGKSKKVFSENKPLVSIGMPVYNGERFIKKAIESILAQTFEDFELVISDNASTDNTKNICQQYTEKDSRIKYYRSRENHGAAWNYNYVYRLSKGKYFKWASHDDICDSTFFDKCIKKIDKNNAIVLCYPKTLIIDEKSNILKKDPKELNLKENRPYKRFKSYLKKSGGECNAIFGIIRSSALKKTSLIKNFVGSDITLLAQLSLLGTFAEIQEELFYRRDHPNTSGRANPDPSRATEWFDTKKIKKIVFPNWRRMREYFQLILDSELPIKEKIHCLVDLTWWHGKKIKLLHRELLNGANMYYERTSGIQ
jgi:glycosyltransferase involved in cell wall biosynthesis